MILSEITSILEPYQDVLNEIHQKLSDFDERHDNSILMMKLWLHFSISKIISNIAVDCRCMQIWDEPPKSSNSTLVVVAAFAFYPLVNTG